MVTGGNELLDLITELLVSLSGTADPTYSGSSARMDPEVALGTVLHPSKVNAGY
jgi:hypothetical protein